MRYLITIILTLCAGACILFSCAKWKDPAPTTDPRLTNPYCNDPNAVNYNWGFPGKPDNSICYYPTDLFKGAYMYHDTIYKNGFFIGADSFLLNIHALTQTKMSVFGFCGGADSILMTANLLFSSSVDTLIGDSITTAEGQMLCVIKDTLSGNMLRDRLDSPAVLHVIFQVITDTGTVQHSGSAIIQ